MVIVLHFYDKWMLDLDNRGIRALSVTGFTPGREWGSGKGRSRWEIMAHLSPTEKTLLRRRVYPKTGFPFIFRYPSLPVQRSAIVLVLSGCFLGHGLSRNMIIGKHFDVSGNYDVIFSRYYVVRSAEMGDPGSFWARIG